MSNGTPVLSFRDPDTFRETGRLTVTDRGAPIALLNELEFVNGEIFANVWQTDRIARISPETGRVTGWIDLAGILPPSLHRVDVLNGIAYDPKAGRLLVTGKLWPAIFEIVLVP
jgi:glutamine cyclotransferase